jgi:hypothetical protein
VEQDIQGEVMALVFVAVFLPAHWLDGNQDICQHMWALITIHRMALVFGSLQVLQVRVQGSLSLRQRFHAEVLFDFKFAIVVLKGPPEARLNKFLLLDRHVLRA